MQRYSDGLAVPKYQMDSFVGETTGPGFGRLDLDLTYVPKSIDDILVHLAKTTLINRTVSIVSLTGKTLRIAIKKLNYVRVTSVVADVGSTGAAPNHTHGLNAGTEVCGQENANNEAQDPIAVHYAVA